MAQKIRTSNGVKIKTALVSVSNKEGIINFAKGLSKLNIDILSTGGTAAIIREAGIKIKEISQITGFPEMLDGRIKTLHPIIHAGILAKRNLKSHTDVLKKHDIQSIDLVVCNLYPFEETIQKSNVNLEEVIENIDIGGPTLIRAAAKNYKDVIVVTNREQYNDVLRSLKSKGDITIDNREKFAVEAYTHTAQYDSIISQYLKDIFNCYLNFYYHKTVQYNTLSKRILKLLNQNSNKLYYINTINKLRLTRELNF